MGLFVLGISAVHQRKVLAAFLEKCPEQYTMYVWIVTILNVC